MALTHCHECGGQISNHAEACPHCGCPVIHGPVQNGRRVECSYCGGKLRKGRIAVSEGSGCLIALIGLCLAPLIIGIPIILYGLHLSGKCIGVWQCKKCHAEYPRKLGFFELG